jgi:2-phospho-L-lactate guanylyltransferase
VSTGSTWALIPARSFRTGKSRLGHLGAQRPAVARALFEHVLATVTASPAIAGVVVATDGDDTAAAALARGADALFDVPVGGRVTLAAIVDRGLRSLQRRGATNAIVVMADLPLLGVDDVARLAGALAGADLVAAPDRDQLGTNALAMRLPAAMATCFGNPDSYHRHLAAAVGAGLHVGTLDRDGLAFDIDGPPDLDDLLATSLEPVASVAGEAGVGPEHGLGVVDAVQRIALLVAESRARGEHAPELVQRGALGRDAARRASDPT